MSETLESIHGQVSSPDRRMHARQRPSSLTYVEIDRENGGIVLDACEGGVSVQAVVSVTEDALSQIRLKLPDSNDWLETRARVVWTRESRKVVGLQFEELSDQSRAQLNGWLSRDASANTTGIAHAAAPAIETEPFDSSAGAAPSQSEVQPSPAFVDDTNQSASDFRDPSPTAALEDSVLTANFLTAPLSLGQKTRVRVEGLETQPVRMPEKKIGPVLVSPKDKFRVSSVYLLLFVLALVSLAAGWAAGRGKFSPVIQKFRGLLQPEAPAAPTIVTRTGPPAAPVNEIELVDANRQHWTIPLQAPIAKIAPVLAQPAPAHTPAPPPEPALNFQIWTLAAPKRSPSPQLAEAVPPAVNEPRDAPEIAPLASGPVALNGYTVPKPGILTGELKRGALVHRVDPEYPALAMGQRVSGTVVLEANIAPDGTVRRVKAISGPRLLVPAAINAVRQWRYAPTLLDGKPVETQVRISLVFHLPSGGQ
jgi:TonB family protein